MSCTDPWGDKGVSALQWYERSMWKGQETDFSLCVGNQSGKLVRASQKRWHLSCAFEK